MILRNVLWWSFPIVIVITPLFLWILPADFFDQSGLITCPSLFFFDVECFGCGMTRAIMHFHHFEFDTAITYNRGVLWMYPMLLYFWLIYARILYRMIYTNFWKER